MSFVLHGRHYRSPRGPTAVVCVDGLDPAYLDAALARADVPTLATLAAEGRLGVARGAMPSFTNPNNASIVTGAPPAVHGISGNHFLDAEGREAPMSRREHLWGDTILDALADQGVRVLAITAKKKLTELLAPRGGHAFSIEAPSEQGLSLLRRARPDLDPSQVAIYSDEASLAVLDAGLCALSCGEAELVYLSTTDYVQHKHGPESPEALAFVEALDRRLAALEAMGARYVWTADHGMNDKTQADGSPKVVYLEAALAAAFGDTAACRVLLPITDPYVVHHGALGSAATVYCPPETRDAARAALRALEGVEDVLTRDEAAERLALPSARIGDLFVLADARTVLGRAPEKHDLAEVSVGLRSHGGLHETRVPWLSDRAIDPSLELRNADAFWWALS
ncbi:MAG: alkaline phosphatase family protein [Myxococcales bacterium]|nr:alkaline phosphatase family protein [Myxococcales bacterium]